MQKKLFSKLRKPAWESKDAGKRAHAIAIADDASVAAHLPDFARSDPDARARRAAVRRLGDLALLADRMRHDDAPEVREVARERLKVLLLDATLSSAERERVLRVEDDQDILAHVATSAGEPELRRLALERCNRSSFIADRCLRDPDPTTRLWLLARIESVPALERISESARKTDKQLAKTARDRVHAIKFAHGDPETLRARVLALCEELDSMRRTRPPDTALRQAALRREWEELRDRVAPEFTQRVEGYFTALAAAHAPPRQVPVPVTSEPVADATCGDALVALHSLRSSREAGCRERPPAERVEQAPAETVVAPEAVPDRAAVLAANAAALAANAAMLSAFEAQVATMHHALDAGQLGAARAAQAVLRTQRDALEVPLSERLLRHIAKFEQGIEKLAQWQHWSNNKIRARLCDEIAAIPGGGHHPDAVAAKVKAAQAEWQRLDESERPPNAEAAPEAGIAGRFRAVCHRALAPTRPYFEKRREVRAERLTAHAALLDEVDRCDDASDPRTRASLRRRVADALRSVDELDPRVRGETSKRLRAALTRFDAMRDAAQARAEAVRDDLYASAEAAKRKLIANLRRELQRATLDDALPRARSAQEQWSRLARTAPAIEEALAREFFLIVDPWFAKSKAAGAAATEARSAREQEERTILDELNELASGEAEGLRHADVRVAALTTRWRTLFAPAPEAAVKPRHTHERGRDRDGDARRRPRVEVPRGERDFDRAVARVREAQEAAGRAREAAALDAARIAATLCEALEDACLTGTLAGLDRDGITARWNALVLPPDAGVPLRQRYDRAQAAMAAPDGVAAEILARNADQAALLAVRAEFLAGIETPERFRPLRRKFQVSRLAERMSGAALPETRDEARQLLIEWCALGPLAPDDRAIFSPRLDAAFAELSRA